jgi:hypothetical protein
MGGAGGLGAQGGTAGAVSGASGTTGGVTPTGGSAGDTGMTGGTAGVGMGGMTGGTAGDIGMGGMTGGTAGDGMGGMPPGGTGGDGGTGGTGGSPCPSVAELFPVGPVGQPSGVMGSLDGRLIMTPCADNPNTDDCNSDGWYYGGVRTGCNGSRLEIRQEFVVGGMPGTMYDVTMHFYGIMEPKIYNAVTREASGRPGDQNTGAMPTPWAYCNTPGCTVPGGTYNSYEIHVMSNTGTEIGTYFLNADTSEPHKTYVINYEKTIPVVGGGRIRMYTTDGNCRQIKNCGSSAGFPCANKARTVMITGTTPPPPAPGALPSGFTQPGLGESNDHSGQWFFTDVVSVACR